jgi:hypothetical protein
MHISILSLPSEDLLFRDHDGRTLPSLEMWATISEDGETAIIDLDDLNEEDRFHVILEFGTWLGAMGNVGEPVEWDRNDHAVEAYKRADAFNCSTGEHIIKEGVSARKKTTPFGE